MSLNNRSKRLMMFAGFVAIVAAYAIYDYQSDLRNEKLKNDQSYLIQLKPEQVSGFKVKNSGGEYELTRDKEGWKIISPIKEAAEQATVDSYLDAVLQEKSSTTVMEGDGINWAQYGLDQPRGVLTVKDNTGKENVLSVGTVRNFQGDSYIRRDNEKQVLLGTSMWFTRIDQKLMDFRDKRLYRGTLVGANSIVINDMHLQRKNEVWIDIAHPTWHLDQNKVREILSMLSQTSGIEIISEGKTAAKDLQLWGLRKPKVSITLKLEDGKTWHADFAQTTEGKSTITRVQLSEPEMVMKIAPSEMGKFQQADVESLRDKLEPFQFNKSDVSEIEVATKEDNAIYKLQAGQWKYQDSSAGRADDDKIKAMLIRLHAYNAIEFVPGNFKAEEHLSLHSPDGKEIFRMEWGSRQMRKYDGVQSAVYLAKTSLAQDTFTILAADIENLKLNDLRIKLSAPAKEGKTK